MRMPLALLLLAAAACGDPGADVDFGDDDMGEDRFAVFSTDGTLRMALTDEFVYFALSDSVRAQARAEMEQDTASRDGIGGAIAGMVRGGVDRALSFRAKFPVTEIREIGWEDGRMVFHLEDGGRGPGRNFKIDDRPAAEAFTEADVRAFAAEFRKVKRRAEPR